MTIPHTITRSLMTKAVFVLATLSFMGMTSQFTASNPLPTPSQSRTTHAVGHAASLAAIGNQTTTGDTPSVSPPSQSSRATPAEAGTSPSPTATTAVSPTTIATNAGDSSPSVTCVNASCNTTTITPSAPDQAPVTPQLPEVHPCGVCGGLVVRSPGAAAGEVMCPMYCMQQE